MTKRECGKTEDVKVKNEPSPADIIMLMCYNRTFNATDCNPLELINCGKSGADLALLHSRGSSIDHTASKRHCIRVYFVISYAG